MAEDRGASGVGTGSRATPQSNLASFSMRSISHGPEMTMAALPALKVAVESHWLRVSVSGDASFSSSISFQVSSAFTAPSVLMCL
ncbi:hypothetical protein D3C78_1669880 [compost metagenome]